MTPGEIMAQLLKTRLEGGDTGPLNEAFKHSVCERFQGPGLKVTCGDHTSSNGGPVLVDVEPPHGRRTRTEQWQAMPKWSDNVLKHLREKYPRALASVVCHENDLARLDHEEWLLAGDGDVAHHRYVQHDDVIYSIVTVERG